MNNVYDFSGLRFIYLESLKRNEPTIAFDVKNGKGCFLFMMFFDPEDIESKDLLYIFMRNTRQMITLKMYGSHNKGQFLVYLTARMEELFKKELLLVANDSDVPFVFKKFFDSLNLSIPNSCSLTQKIITLRESWKDIANKLPSEINDGKNKVYLIGCKRLTLPQKPRECTLRKLYLFAEGNPNEITLLVEKLKRINCTLVWTTEERANTKSISRLLTEI